MSIPPLVCSTPPPPDQCEDDKEPEDFDIQYPLSQEDDYESNEYGYGNLSLNNFKTIPDEDSEIELPIISSDDNEIDNNFPNHKNYFDTASQLTNNNTKIEDNAIEDLDLKLDQVSINSGIIGQDDADLQDSNESSSFGIDDNKDDIIANSPESIIQTQDTKNEFQTNSEISHEVVIENDDLTETENVDTQPILQEQIDEIIETEDVDFKFIIEEQSQETNLPETNFPSNSNSSEIIKSESDDNDDFGEFDDCKFVGTDSNTITTTTIVDNCDNPWGEGGSNNFKANFNDFQTKSIETNFQNPTENKDKENIVDDDDDFGDFDDFKSSTVKSKVIDSDNSSTEHPIFNLQSADNYNQFVEKSLSSIFEYDLSDTETQFEERLESLLSETWRQLTDVEVRLPYMINWNNSLGQKTLLKALCIDSRNILFGPKWAYNTPKYAVNLTAAPLQPQKPVVSSNISAGDSLTPDKSTGKATDTWVDPFTSDGKESCNVENSKSTAPQRATNLQEFQPAISTNAEKILSSTLSVQPIRQINLPDTHIFTPTDSEIPRSKTIHYDNGSTGLVPQPASTNDTENEYSDFQDFKGTTDSSLNSNESVSRIPNVEESNITTISLKDTSITYQTSILQPIKLEPLTPTLNWPDPGEIKTTFEDFSEFVSNTQWANENHISTTAVISGEDTGIGNINIISNNSHTFEDTPVSTNNVNNNDDDFATFQSAVLPIQTAPRDLESDQVKDATKTTDIEKSSSLTTEGKEDLDIVFPNWDKSDTLSDKVSVTQPQITMATNQSYIPKSINSTEETLHSFKTSQTHCSVTPVYQVLRPTPATSGSTVQKPNSTQILQPLSLEGYSQINWPNPGSIDLQDLSRFNPVETLPSLKSELNGGHSKNASPAHSQKSKTSDDDWGDFVSSKPKQPPLPKMQPTFVDEDEWTDFVSSPSVQSQNGLNTISLNVHTNLNVQKASNQNKYKLGSNPPPLDIPSLNYVTPKTNHHRSYNPRHFQNL